MRSVSVAAVLVGLALTGCGAAEPVGDETPAPTASTAVSTTSPSSTTSSSDSSSSVEPSTTEAPVAPYDPEATVRPDLMVVTPDEVAPGDRVELTFPAETMRGVAYVLERSAGDGWSTTHFLTSSTAGYGGGPGWVSVDDPAGYGWDDIGIAGPGPDELAIPDDAAPGAYRICTANARENFCADITLVEEVDPDVSETTPETTIPVPIVAVHEGVAFYPACGNETLTFEGATWYQLNSYDGYDEEYAAIYEAFADADREPSPVVGPRGFARVVAPGPGDDIGTLVIWADGVARWVSDSRDLDTWMVDDEITYNWDC